MKRKLFSVFFADPFWTIPTQGTLGGQGPALCAVRFGGFRKFRGSGVWERYKFISHKVFLKSFCKSQFPHNSVNLFFILVIVKDKLTDFLGS